MKSNNNCIFGGYTKIGFKKSYDNTFKDDEAFVFSLNKNKIYPVIKGKEAIRCCHCCCPQFYQETIYLYKNFLRNTSIFVNSKKNDYYQGFREDYELNDGKKNFSIKDLEIYQLTFE